jgi:hypothetical protein
MNSPFKIVLDVQNERRIDKVADFVGDLINSGPPLNCD